ncbi:hypothetical protein BGX38DRAFT_1212726 [Terfezia claveryi]|nr:hypothetical protein BGX38DRAFT_1212726 [Terfezia claveryi]
MGLFSGFLTPVHNAACFWYLEVLLPGHRPHPHTRIDLHTCMSDVSFIPPHRHYLLTTPALFLSVSPVPPASPLPLPLHEFDWVETDTISTGSDFPLACHFFCSETNMFPRLLPQSGNWSPIFPSCSTNLSFSRASFSNSQSSPCKPSHCFSFLP